MSYLMTLAILFSPFSVYAGDYIAGDVTPSQNPIPLQTPNDDDDVIIMEEDSDYEEQEEDDDEEERKESEGE